jgi:hypothetical protein
MTVLIWKKKQKQSQVANSFVCARQMLQWICILILGRGWMRGLRLRRAG